MADRAASGASEAGFPESRRARNKARTTAAILDAAKACIADNGVQAATMDQIAAAAAVSRATLFNYFASKADIVDVLIEQNEAGFYTAIEAWRHAPALTAGERLLGLFAATAQYLRRASPIERVLVGVSWLNWNDAAGVVRIARVLDAFAGVLADGCARGEIDAALDLRVAAEIVCHTYLGIIHAWRMDDGYPVAERLDASARLLAAMLSPHAPAPGRVPKLPRASR